jgi:hypothetical protein
MTATFKAADDDPVIYFTPMFDIMKNHRDAEDAFKLPRTAWGNDLLCA